MNGNEIEKVDDFLLLGGNTNSPQDINTPIGESWNTLSFLQKSWALTLPQKRKLEFLNLLLSPYCYTDVNPG